MTRRLLGMTCALLAACSDGSGPAATATDPAGASFIASDIAHFWEAFDARDFQRLYLDRASPGLRDFIRSRNITAASLAQMVQAYRRYFAAIRDNTLSLTPGATVLTTVRANFEKMEDLYPAAIYPPVTFLIGRFSTGGTTSSSGMLIGTEFYAIDRHDAAQRAGHLPAQQRATALQPSTHCRARAHPCTATAG